jgi:16S rRNA A1518/A1519 N6-dimethyltransferase RsmA/KsgA/DIM1 with predicted DNA glycosylase/AP lyase activity
MYLLMGVGIFVLSCFTVVLFFGAPFLPTLSPQIEVTLDLLDLKRGQTLLELGCGDGRVMLAAAKRGIIVVGYELNPILAAIAWLRTRQCGSHVTVVWGNYWQIEWPPAEGIFAFLLSRYMLRLDAKVTKLSQRPIKVASFAFTIPGKQPITQKAGIYLYIYT